MKAKNAVYWTTTSPIALETFAGGFIDLTHRRTGVFSGPYVTDLLRVWATRVPAHDSRG